jgi:hypothetical protein
MPKPKLTASLFAHIENDAYLTGTFGLESNNFSNTIPYLKHYVLHREKLGKPTPACYTKLLEDL